MIDLSDIMTCPHCLYQANLRYFIVDDCYEYKCPKCGCEFGDDEYTDDESEES